MGGQRRNGWGMSRPRLPSPIVAIMAVSLMLAGASLAVYLLFWLVSPGRTQDLHVIGTVAAILNAIACGCQTVYVKKIVDACEGERGHVVPLSKSSLVLSVLALAAVLASFGGTVISLRGQPDVPVTERLAFPGLGMIFAIASGALSVVAGNLVGAWKGRAAAGE